MNQHSENVNNKLSSHIEIYGFYFIVFHSEENAMKLMLMFMTCVAQEVHILF